MSQAGTWPKFLAAQQLGPESWGRGDVLVKYNFIVLQETLGGGAMSSTFRETLPC